MPSPLFYFDSMPMILYLTLLLTLLTALNYKRGGWWIPTALAAASVGEFCALMGGSSLQLIARSLMLLLLVADFVPYCDNRRTWAGLASALVALVVASLLAGAEERVPMTLYGVLVATMVVVSAFQRRTGWGWYLLAASCFALSMVLQGVDRYLLPLEGWRWLIDVSCIASLLLFALLNLKRRHD